VNRASHFIAALALGLAFGWTSSGRAQQPPPDDVRRRLAALEAGQRAIQQQLEEIAALLRAQKAGQPGAPPAAPPLPADLPTTNAATRGKPGAPLTIVEFSDFQCPFCGQQTRNTMPQIMKEYVDTGKVRYVFRHFPLESIHPQAFKAHEAAECARLQGKPFEMHEKLFANQNALGAANLLSYAGSVGLDMPKFQACMGGAAQQAIRQDLDAGVKAGVTGTPAIFIGRTQPDGSVKVLRRLSGMQQYAAMRATIEGLLAAPPAKKK
jgi:protein-disulfide isomerase